MHYGFGGGKASINPLREATKVDIFLPMHFSTHIARLHSTFSLMAALLLRGAR
jgi:hypothetical protein